MVKQIEEGSECETETNERKGKYRIKTQSGRINDKEKEGRGRQWTGK